MKVFKKGDKVKIGSGSGPSSGCPHGKGVIVSKAGALYRLTHENGVQYNAYAYELTGEDLTKEQLEKELEALEQEREIIRSKIVWMEDAGVKVYNKDQHRVWKALTILEGAKSKIEKAKIIADLINS